MWSCSISIVAVSIVRAGFRLNDNILQSFIDAGLHATKLTFGWPRLIYFSEKLLALLYRKRLAHFQRSSSEGPLSWCWINFSARPTYDWIKQSHLSALMRERVNPLTGRGSCELPVEFILVLRETWNVVKKSECLRSCGSWAMEPSYTALCLQYKK